MSAVINELPQIEQEILIMLRRQKVSTQRITVSLKAAGHDCPDPLPSLQALVELEFVTCEASAEGEPCTWPCTCPVQRGQVQGRPGQVHWFLTNRGMVAAELLWFERRFDDPSRLFRALGGR